ncbi:MAG: hypothetical protein H8D23_00885 [Candidatus Brocadiales bacterium]|nr:hypothetical protein [Candidatus Brocadiales bacterium]
MQTINKEKKEQVHIDKSEWLLLKANPNYTQLIEDIEDRLELKQAIKGTKSFVAFDDYDKKRKK